MNWKVYYKLFFFFIFFCAQLSAIELPFEIFRVNTEEKMVFLTFDDGPHPEYTSQIVAILNQYNVPAIFFLIGESVQKFPLQSKLIVDSGFNIGNHTFSHVNINRLTQKSLLKEVAKSQLVIWETLGVLPHYFRPPYGRLQERYKHYLKRHFKHIIRWSVDPQEWRGEVKPKMIIKDVIKVLEPGCIVLLHESEKTIKLLPALIKQVRRQGYVFKSFDDILLEN